MFIGGRGRITDGQGRGDPLLIWVVNEYHRANVELDGLILRNTGIQYWQAFNFYWLQILIKIITGILWCIAVRFFMLQIYGKCQYIFFNIFIKGKRNKRVIISKVVHNFPQLRARLFAICPDKKFDFGLLEIPKFSFSFDFVNDLMVEMKFYTKDIYLSF